MWMVKMGATALALGCTTLALAQAEWPAKPMRLVIPVAPGGGTDFLGRMLAQKLAEQKEFLDKAAAASKQAALEELTKRLQAEFADERSRLQKKFDAQLGEP